MAGRNLRASEAFYNFVGPQFECAYCGEPADTEDHTTPAWFVEGNTRLIERYKLFKVAACRDCNGRAGMKVDKTFLERRRRIAVSIRRKKRRLLGIADWETSEVQELGHSLKDYIKRGHELATILRQRLAMLDSFVMPHGVPNVLLQPFATNVEDWEEDGKVVWPMQWQEPTAQAAPLVTTSKRPKRLKQTREEYYARGLESRMRAAKRKTSDTVPPCPPTRLFTTQLVLSL